MSDYMTLEQMREFIGRHVQMNTASGTKGRTRIDEWLNATYHDVVREHDWPSLMDGSEASISVTAGEKYVYLPKYVQQVKVIQASSLDTNLLHQSPANIMRRIGGVNDSSGSMVMYADAGELGRKADFSTTAETINCSVASGTDNIDVLIYGLNADGDRITETVTISSGVAADSTTSLTDLISASTNGGQTVPVVIKGTDSATEYATIAANERTVRYKRLRVWAVPDQAETLILYYKRRVADLTDDDQVPEIPVSQVLIHRVVAMQYSHDRKWASAAQYHEAMAERTMERLVAEAEVQADEVHQAIPMMNRHNRRGSQGGIIIVSN